MIKVVNKCTLPYSTESDRMLFPELMVKWEKILNLNAFAKCKSGRDSIIVVMDHPTSEGLALTVDQYCCPGHSALISQLVQSGPLTS